MKRKHAELIKTWADNQELTVLVEGCGYWVSIEHPSWGAANNYFICLPKHKEAVIELLNGGEIQVSRGCEAWTDCGLGNEGQWHRDYWYMDKGFKSRIKPRKQTRYAYATPDGGITVHYSTKDELERYCIGMLGKNGFKLITFEIEI